MEEAGKAAGGKKLFLIFSVLLLMTTGIAASYGGSIVLPGLLVRIGAMDFYSVCAAAATMGMMLALALVGALCSKFGVKTVALLGVALQICSRIAVMFTNTISLFVVLWAVNGVGSGFFVSSPYSIMADIVTAEERPKYYGYITTFSAIGALAGPLLCGAVADWGSLNMAMMSYLVFAVIPVIGLGLFYPNKKRPGAGKFDFMGILLLVVAVAGIVMWLSLGGKSFDFISPVGLSLLAMGIIGGIALILVESKSANPSVSVRMFRKPRFRTTFLVQIFLVAYSSCAAAFGIVYVQQVMRDSSLASSTVTMPQTIVQAVMGFFVGSYIGKNFKNRFRPFAVLALAVYTIAMAMFSSLQPSSSMVVIYIATALGGIGQSITQSTYAAFFQTELKPEEISGAQGMYQFGSSGGSCIFMAIGSLVLNAGFTLNHIFMLGTAFCAVALVIGLIGFRFPKTETPE